MSTGKTNHQARRWEVGRALGRPEGRKAGRPEERWSNLLSWIPEESIISWAWYRHAIYRERYSAAMRDPANAHLRFVRLGDRAAVRRFLAQTAAGLSAVRPDT